MGNSKIPPADVATVAETATVSGAAQPRPFLPLADVPAHGAVVYLAGSERPMRVVGSDDAARTAQVCTEEAFGTEAQALATTLPISMLSVGPSDG